VGFDEELSHACEVLRVCGSYEIQNSPIFGSDVASSFVVARLFNGGIAERLHADLAAGFPTFGYSCAIGGVSERVLHHGVDGYDCYVIGERDGLRFEGAAVDLQGSVFASEEGDVLVHDAAGHAYEVDFGSLTEPGYFQAVQFAVLE
jgi:hypothetical protein